MPRKHKPMGKATSIIKFQVAAKKPRLSGPVVRNIYNALKSDRRSLNQVARDHGIGVNAALEAFVEMSEEEARRREQKAFERGRLSIFPTPPAAARRAA